MVPEGRDVNGPINEADFVFVDSGGEDSESGSGKELEKDEDGDVGRTARGDEANAGRMAM